MKIYDFGGKKNICGARVKEARKKLNISQANLAARLQVFGVNIERDSVSRIEIGTRFVADYELLAISEVLGVTTKLSFSSLKHKNRQRHCVIDTMPL